MSVDAPDNYGGRTTPSVHHENLSVNDIESLGEFLLEDCLGIIDALPEHDEPDDESSITELEQDYIFPQLFVFTPFLKPTGTLMSGITPFSQSHLPTPSAKVMVPPPQLVA